MYKRKKVTGMWFLLPCSMVNKLVFLKRKNVKRKTGKNKGKTKQKAISIKLEVASIWVFSSRFLWMRRLSVYFSKVLCMFVIIQQPAL